MIFYRFSFMHAKYFSVYFCRTIKFDARVANLIFENRKRVACVYGLIMHAGNVGRIREKRVKHEA